MGLPHYLRASVPNPADKRAPWFKNTAPAYAGIFLAVIFYQAMAENTLSQASVATCLAGLLVGGLIAWLLFYTAPAMLGMKTGRPLYIVGTSTFGVQGNYLPGFLMGLLQVGFIGVITYLVATYILAAAHTQSQAALIVISIIWAYALAWFAMRGIGHVARLGNIFNWIPLIMLIVVVAAVSKGIGQYHPAVTHSGTGFALMIDVVLGFFATAGAAGADFGINSRNGRDVTLGGLFGIAIAAVVAGGLAILGVAGAIGLNSPLPVGVTNHFDFSAAIGSVGSLAGIVYILFVIALIAPCTFSTFIATNSFSTLIPNAGRSVWAYAAATGGIILSITGLAANLGAFFGLVGATFAPVCGAMTVDYLLAGKKWSGPRHGINWAGYAAWIIGCWVGLGMAGAPARWQAADHPAALYSYIAAFIVYWVLAKAGIRPALIDEKELQSAAKA